MSRSRRRQSPLTHTIQGPSLCHPSSRLNLRRLLFTASRPSAESERPDAESERRDAEPAEALSLRLAWELLQFRPAPDAMDAWLDRIAALVHNAAPAASQQQREPSRARQPSHGQEHPRGAAPPPQ